ncbi:Nitrilotriacetate monooxygenase component A (plasmid) [Tsukamurella tyrosinosolvens]|uniref:FMN-dependent oxidoreductase, nitrilotriacetate monooxygenase family n=1 Tax=Tsukamurella tyrosinosolvens TaxID=57704 RepID=A0A1H4SW13_TSUTY|nr:NtaA/DmoA family FMN-dependent monooxygenase [Tsukamurella tyrosinosolvens]KXO93361.1 F420-dependent methylene-tetrahydromethanopterin reductase [Tsukamurella tyrosinosolvens]SEC48372.1 FMN-dependent oxidoreductase, nitrilotriacetate monooxygenase family [Tsukamurella tyrosinosolvens]VEH99024.1 Nitrilotriacetate monooxygenase component A [Tsukamurella tyrosinosolvens]
MGSPVTIDRTDVPVREGLHRKPIHLAAHFPGVNHNTVWSDPAARSQVEFESFVYLARAAERAKFDFFFLAEGLRLREHLGRIHDLDVVGRPDTFTVLTALAAVTDRIGLAGTINTTFNEPFDVARQFATLDHLSGGRAAWNMVTSSDAFTGENFRRGGYLAHADRYHRADEFVTVARKFWDGWDRGDVVHHGTQFDVRGAAPLPPSPQGHPVLLQAGDSGEGRDFAAAQADAIFTRHGSLESGRAFYADVKRRAADRGRNPDHLKVFPGAAAVVGDTTAEAQEKAHDIRRRQVSPQTALNFLEQVWGRELQSFDPDGPLPDVEPVYDAPAVQGRVLHADPREIVATYRERAEAGGLSIRELVIELNTRPQFVGTAQQVADEIDTYIQADAADGFILVPHLTPTGLDEFIDGVVPLLQERGAFRTEYAGTTLRDHLGLPVPETASGVQRAG